MAGTAEGNAGLVVVGMSPPRRSRDQGLLSWGAYPCDGTRLSPDSGCEPESGHGPQALVTGSSPVSVDRPAHLLNAHRRWLPASLFEVTAFGTKFGVRLGVSSSSRRLVFLHSSLRRSCISLGRSTVGWSHFRRVGRNNQWYSLESPKRGDPRFGGRLSMRFRTWSPRC